MEEQENARSFWRKFEFAGIAAAIVTLLFVVIGQSAEQFAFSVAGDETQASDVKRKFNAIDYAATGSTSKRPVVIGPCTDRQP